MGFKRPDWKVGIRNEVWIIPTVGCVNNIAKQIAKTASSKQYQNVDGVFAYTHPYGCSQLGDDQLYTQKGGKSPVEDVLGYGERVNTKGLSLLQGSGNDLVASCALAGSGAHIVLFTTGRGTPFGCPVPTVKISSNTELYKKKGGWIDFNAGTLVEGDSFDEVTENLLDFVIDIANGKKTKSKFLDKSDIAIFKDGVTL